MKRLIISDLIKRLKYYVIITFLSMTVNFSNRRIIYRCKSKTSKSGKKQFHFNVPNSPFRSGIINPDKEYFIYYIEETLEQNKVVTNDLEKLKGFLPLLENKIPFASKVAQPGGQYRINLPKDVIKNNLLDPQKKVNYWIYFVEEINANLD